MAKKSRKTRSNYSDYPAGGSRRKSAREAKVERITWFLMVMVFAVLYIVQQQQYNIPNWLVPFSGATILLGSGIYQYTRRWHVSPLTWIAGTIMLLLTITNLYINPEMNFFGFTLMTFALVIGFGVLTGET